MLFRSHDSSHDSPEGSNRQVPKIKSGDGLWIYKDYKHKKVGVYSGVSVYNANGQYALGGSIMNTDFAFVRDFLLAVEREETDPVTPLTKDQLGFSTIPDGIFSRQVILFGRAELLEVIKQKTEIGHQYFAIRLTKAGLAFLNEIRDKEIWKRILSIHTEEVQTFSLSVLLALTQRVVELHRKNE